MCSEDEAEHEDISDNATARNADGVLPAGCTYERGWAELHGQSGLFGLAQFYRRG